MRRISSIAICVSLLVLGGSSVGPRDALAQSPGATVLQLNQQAMAAYGGLQISRALELLTQAEAMCRQYRVGGMALARTYANMGLVEAAGLSNNAAAMHHFKLAVCADPNVTIDPLSSTPDVEVLFNMARAQAQSPGACRGVPQAKPLPPPQPLPIPRVVPRPKVQPKQAPVPIQASQLTRHLPVPQQQRLVPVPVFVEINPVVEVGSVTLFYRTLGERVYQQIPMTPMKSGYAATIGCDVLQTFDPTGIEYYIAVYGTNQQLVGTSGTEAEPFQVAIVAQRTGPEPSLPGLPAPSACVEECPPWNPDCNKLCKKDYSMCDSSADCCTGYTCVEEKCTLTEGGSEGNDRSGGKKHVRIPIVAGTGFGILPAETTRAYNQVASSDLSLAAGTAWDKFHGRIGLLFHLTPDMLLGVGFRADMALDFNGDVPFLRPAFIANFGYRVAGKDRSPAELWTLFGLGGGQFQHRVSYKDCRTQTRSPSGNISCTNVDDRDIWTQEDPFSQNYFRKAGYVIVEAGLETNLWFKKGGAFGWNFGLLADLLVAPNFAVNFDVQSGPVLRF
jgi:hypothetical protein